MINTTSNEEPIIKFLRKYSDIDLKHFNSILKAHPEYPSFSSIFHTLNYFSVDVEIYETSLNSLDPACHDFFAILKDENDQFYISYLTRKEDKFYAGSTLIPGDELYKSWSDTIFVINKQKKVSYLQPNTFTIVSIVTFLCLALTLLFDALTAQKAVLFLFTFCGIFLSILALNVELNIMPALNRFCRSGHKTDCNSVITSKKSKISVLNKFSELGLAFFITQFIFLYISGSSVVNLSWLYVFLSFPFILLSIYYQLYIVKKLCIICLFISLILIVEFIYLYFVIKSPNDASYIVKYFLIQILIFSLLTTFKNYNLNSSKHIATNLSLKRFLNNSNVFKQLYFNQTQLDIKFDFLFYEEKPINLTIITEPFCDHCKELHHELETLLSNLDSDSYNVSVIFNIDSKEETEDDLLLYLTMVKQQSENKNTFYFNYLGEWFAHRNVKKWTEKYSDDNRNFKTFEQILEKQHQWCNDNNILHTPVVLLNGRIIPECYSIADLNYILDYFADLEYNI